MKIIKDDIWKYRSREGVIVIPTNIGWKADKSNVMGAGLALQVKNKFPKIPELYGQECINHKEKLGVTFYPNYSFLMFPVKELNITSPHLSWQNNATLKRVEKSCKSFVDLLKNNIMGFNFYMPLVGTGNGKLPVKDVMELLDKYLSCFDNVYIVDKK